MTEPSVEEIVSTFDKRQHPHKHFTESESRILAASWREQGRKLSELSEADQQATSYGEMVAGERDALLAMTERLLKVLTEVYDFLRDQGFDELADVVDTAIEDRP